jgi:plasmid stabilization system protein ParE
VFGYEYHPAAEAEYLAAVERYSKIDPQLGMAFVVEIENTIGRVRQFPEAWPPLPGNLRRALTHRFPYSVIYEVMADRIFIWAVVHASREPGYWRRRLAPE